MAWTKAKLAEKVLENIGVKAAGQPVSSDYANYVKDSWTSVYDQLSDVSLVPFPANEIPDWALFPLIKYLSVEVGPRFGRPQPEGLKNIAMQELARSRFGGRADKLPVPAKDY